MQDKLLRYQPIVVRIVQALVIISLIIILSFLFLEKIRLGTIDLGRHIKNGELVLGNPDILYRNFYSYTEPEHPFINHHWLAGVLYFGLFKLFAWSGLSIFNLLAVTGSLAMSFILAAKRGNFWIAAALSVPVIFLVSERNEIRPEIISGLFLMIYFWILSRVRAAKEVKNIGWVFFFLHLAWANIHIYSFLGLLIVSFAFLDEMITNSQWSFKKITKSQYLKILLILVAAGLITPNFIEGFLYPLNILRTYGYEVVENKSIFYLENLMINHNILIFKYFAAVGLIIVACSAAIKKRLAWFDLLTLIFFFLFGAFALRNIALAGLVAMPIVAGHGLVVFQYLLKKKPELGRVTGRAILSAMLAVEIYAGHYWVFAGNYFSSQGKTREFGLGLEPSTVLLGDFLVENNIAGPIFNNYDVGSYLDFYLAPKERVFVDNRPEAYSVGFFDDYRKMQEDPKFWEEKLDEYKFNAVVITHIDGTPWAGTFLLRIVGDPQWKLVHMDPVGMVFLKKNDGNQAIIEKHGHSREGAISEIERLGKTSSVRDRNNMANLAGIWGAAELQRSLLRSLIADDPDNYSYKINLAAVLSNPNPADGKNDPDDLREAKKLVNEVIDQGTRLPSIYNQLGLICLKRGEAMEAREAWQNALKVDSSNEWAKYYLAMTK